MMPIYGPGRQTQRPGPCFVFGILLCGTGKIFCSIPVNFGQLPGYGVSCFVLENVLKQSCRFCKKRDRARPYQPKGDIGVTIPLADDLKGETVFGISKEPALKQGLFYVSAARGGSQQVCRGGRQDHSGKSLKSKTTLTRIRRANGFSQKHLAEVSDVALRMIRLYEQRQNDINKARTVTLIAPAKPLNCRVEDLAEPQMGFEH